MTNNEFDYSEYGVFNGKPTIPNYNREERRKYIKELKNNKYESICPNCNHITRKMCDDNGKIFCELCGKVI